MESPVMTSASSHRLRSAVGACAQPTHSYLNSSYLSTSIKVESQDSGGCFKKFRTGKNGESLPLNVNKKSHTAEFLPLYKRQKLAHKNNLSHQRAKAGGKEIENSSTNRVLDLIPKQFMIGNDFLSKLKLNGKFLEPKRLAEYLDKAARHETVVDNCEKVIDDKSSLNSSKKSNGSCNNNNNSNNNNNNNNNNKKILNRHNNCNKGRSKHQKSLTAPNKDSINGEIVRSDNCAVHLDKGIKNERQEILNWQPKHVVTRRTAQIFRPIRNAWQKQVESSKYAPAEKSSQLFCDLQQFPSASQVTEMLEYSKECPCNPTANVTVPYNEYFRINSSIIEFKDARSSPICRSRDKNVKKRTRKFSKGMNKYEVFLGGSCNPTTWRTDFAIPELEKVGITYYNPQQVDEWRPELLEKEYHAKENAIVMFFVLDNQTRGVSALIEVAHLAGNQRKLILVIQSYTQKNQTICDEQISKEEYEDLKTGQDVLQTLVERQGIPVFDDIQKALKCTEKVLRENLRVQDLQAPVRVSRENSISPEDVFEKLDSSDSGEISASDVCLALRMLTGIQISTDHLNTLIVNGGRNLNGTLLDDVKFDQQHFSELVSEFRQQLQDGMFSDLPTSLTWYGKDVYLGGTIEHTSWRESIAIPALEAQNLRFFVPKINEKGKRFTEIEAAAMDNSFVLLFVITKTARSIAAMAIAGHYIGKGAKVVLCVEHLPENAIINEELLSESAVKDYNRGRMYLMDIAERSDVPVFNDISKAVNFVVEKCRNR